MLRLCNVERRTWMLSKWLSNIARFKIAVGRLVAMHFNPYSIRASKIWFLWCPNIYYRDLFTLIQRLGNRGHPKACIVFAVLAIASWMIQNLSVPERTTALRLQHPDGVATGRMHGLDMPRVRSKDLLGSLRLTFAVRLSDCLEEEAQRSVSCLKIRCSFR